MKAFYICGTHWDREWYEPFQNFRSWLVDVIDEAMDLLEKDPEYRCFHLDCQTVVLEDYLEIRPEQRDRLVRHLREGRLIAGPWYNLPDEWLVSGESLVRNFLRGFSICRNLGFEPPRFCYTPDQFGHIAALPMIASGFGLKTGLVWRGTQDETHPALFTWEGPDGSRMITFKLMDDGGYVPFRANVREPVKRGDQSDDSYRQCFEAWFEKERARTPAPFVLLLDAGDHDRVDPQTPNILARLRELYPDIEFVWARIDEFGQEMLKYEENAPEYIGELRMPARDPQRRWQYLIDHTISSRYPIKHRNAACQALLEKWAEPYALFESMAGGKPIVNYLEKAWEYLLRNHPHDSICGCSMDQIHRDMLYRFDQSSLIGEIVVKRAFAHIVPASAEDSALSNLVIHNPLPFARRGVFDLVIPFKPGWPHTYVDGLTTGEPINRFRIVGANGEEIPYQLLRIERNVESKRLGSDARGHLRAGEDWYHVAAEMNLPASGYTGIHIEPTPLATRNLHTMLTEPLAASNGVLSVRIQPNGTVTVVHEPSGNEFSGWFLYEDCGDSGDGWTRGELVEDIVFRSPGSRCTTAIKDRGRLRTTFRIEREFDLPREMVCSKWKRSDDRVVLRVIDEISLDKGSPLLRVQTTVFNTVKDHRFRVLFPTDVNTRVSFAETPFALVERPIRISTESATWHERPNPEHPFTTFFGVEDGKRGVAVLAPFAPHEYEVFDDARCTLALTLFRSTFKTIAASSEPDGELLQPMVFDYALLPFADPFDPVRAARRVAELQAGIKTHHAESVPQPRTFLEQMDGNTVVTAIKLAADGNGGIVRLWNPKTIRTIETLRFAVPLTSAALCNLNEEIVEPIHLDDAYEVRVPVSGHALSTVRFTWDTSAV